MTSQIHSLREFRSGGRVDGVNRDSDDAPEAAQALDRLRGRVLDLEVQRVLVNVHFGSGHDAAAEGRQQFEPSKDRDHSEAEY